MIIQTIYKKPTVRFLFLLETNNMLFNSPLNRVDFQLLQNQNNKLTFFVKNSDRKSVNLLGQIPIFRIVQPTLNMTIYEKNMIVEDEFNGKISVTLNPSDTTDWETGYLTFHVSLLDQGIETFLHTDMNQSTSGWCELIKNPVPRVLTPKVFTQWTPIDYIGTDVIFRSEKLFGAAHGFFNKEFQTIQITLNDFVGTIKMQATLDIMGDNDWFDVDLNPYDNQDDLVFEENTTNTFGFDINGSFEFIRFQYFGNNEPLIKTITF